MQNRYSWLFYRFQSMSVPELLFRTQQYVQKKTDKKRIAWVSPVTSGLNQLPDPILPLAGLSDLSAPFSNQLKVFTHRVNVDQPIDWHFDISTGKRFPLEYAKTINIRDGQNGSAKYVWEVNRLQWLPSLAIAWRTTGDRRYLDQFMAVNRSWIQHNPYLLGVNWYSNIEVNIRLINWFFAWNILDASALAQSDAHFAAFVTDCWLPSIHQHCVYSYSNPSLHSSANNHLISEYAGLFIAGSFWRFPESAKWVTYAKTGLEKEIQAQHSKNGINREEAAEYIQFITDFFLIAYVVGKLTNNSFSVKYTHKLNAIASYIATFLDCKGNFPHYGDEDDGRVLVVEDKQPFNNFQSILTSAAILFKDSFFKQRSHGFDLKNFLLFGKQGQESFKKLATSKNLPESKFYDEGHYILRKQTAKNQEIYIHVDAAPLGFLSIAAHGHADALSFLMNVDGYPFLVDSGTYSYQTHPEWRNYFLSTKAHNTVCIDEQNQAFQAGPLLWLNHYKATTLHASSTELIDEITATHNGYDRIQCRHQRTFRFDKAANTLYIDDVVDNAGKQSRQLDVMFHLGPDVKVLPTPDTIFQLQHKQAKRQIQLTIAPDLQTNVIHGQQEPVLLGWYSDGFYHKEATSVIQARLLLEAGQTVHLQHKLIVQ
ncbi:alginate lyase family protein [Spirosoma sp. KNUC1025]|uniref:alginate lyase family protein n=1 Tax=Spirosoma sp. KNUC1025 TaxID=2894082 RepID=UPI00386B8AB2|nr:heparinase II/III family protein [Spirosoma sp. KNUC1025]